MKRESKRRAYRRLARQQTRLYQAQVRNETDSVDPKTGNRTKTNKRSHTFSVEGRWINHAGTTGWHPYKRTATVNLEDKVTYGKNIPGWRDKLQHGIGVVTSLSGVKQTLKVNYGGQVTIRSNPWNPKTSLEGSFTGPLGAMMLPGWMPVGDTSTSATAEQLARTRLLQSYMNQVQSFSGGKFLAELKDSIDLVTHPVRSVYRKTWEYAGTVKKLGRIYQHRPRTAAAALSESWLAFSFGVKPFLQDANDAAKALNRLVQNPREDLRYVSGTGNDRSASSSDLTYTADDGSVFSILRDTKSVSSVRFRGAFRQKPTGTGNLLDEFGLNVLDIAPSIWEGIPWSFFVDYFSNVSECLDAWRLIFVDQAWLIRTVRNRTTTTLSPRNRDRGPSIVQTVSGDGSSVGSAVYVNRSATSFFAETPTFHFKLPGKDLSRMLNITSLIGVINDSRWGSRAPL